MRTFQFLGLYLDRHLCIMPFSFRLKEQKGEVIDVDFRIYIERQTRTAIMGLIPHAWLNNIGVYWECYIADDQKDMIFHIIHVLSK